MALTPGARLGQFEILASLGGGGMGVVFRARDVKLQRDVALKLLPDVFAGDPERLARFHREAQVLASLNHQNIAQVYGLEDSTPQTCIVMELVDGETLADRLRRGPLPLDDALRIAARITDALEAAHEKGIIHRDLKPANIKITPDDKVKVLDFGLAKMFRDETLNPAFSNSPTMMSAGSMPGMILGTAAYMSPEQARGKAVDKRTDIWAFGIVLIEMLTGRPVFDGETLTDVLGAIVHKEPDWTKLPAEIPSALLRLLRRCLVKDPHQRLHDIADARLEIEAALREPQEASSTSLQAPAKSRRWIGAVAVSVLAVGLLIGAVASWWTLSSKDTAGTGITNASGPLIHTVIDLPANGLLSLGTHIPAEGFDNPVVALSPDGKYLAYVGQSGPGTTLYLREMAGTTVRPLAGTEGALHPFFSPDGQWVGFLTDNQVKKVPVVGGDAKTLCDANTPAQGWWHENEVIYFSEREGGSLSRVAAEGGKPSIVAAGDALANALSAPPQITDVLPGGRALIVSAEHGISKDYSDIEIFSIADSKTKRIVRSGYGARFVQPNYLVFARAGSLLGARFDSVRLELQGEPVTIATGVSMESLFGQVHAAVSTTGLLAFVPGGERAIGKLAWVDRKGVVEFLEAPQRVYGVVDLSPNGKRLAVEVADVTDYIWIYDIERREGRRLSSSEDNLAPAWAPDNIRIAYASRLKDMPFTSRILVRSVDDPAMPIEILKASMDARWSADGRVLAIHHFDGHDGVIAFVSSADGKPESVIKNKELSLGFVEFSPDGRWIAYSIEQSGQSEVWIRSYPDGKISRQISTDGGIEPVWCPCGGKGELFYRKGNRWFSTKVTTSPELQWDPPRQVFQTDFIDTPGLSYDVSPDGQRLLVVKRAEPDVQNKLHLITNWYRALDHK